MPARKAARSAKASTKRKVAKPAKKATPSKRVKATSRAKAPRRAKAPSRAKATPMFDRIAFTMFSVQDATRARAFYEEVLGLERGLASPDGVWTEYDLPGGGCLALFGHAMAGGPSGGASVAFEVAGLDALNERLKAHGVVYDTDVIHGPNCRMSNIRDSEGNSIILHELAKTKRR